LIAHKPQQPLIPARYKAYRIGDIISHRQQREAPDSKPKLLINRCAEGCAYDRQGHLPLEPQAGHLFFQLISLRYEQGSVLISSNRPVEEWDEVFGDQVVAAAILDRLLHHSHVVTIRGDSYRLREKRRQPRRPEGNSQKMPTGRNDRRQPTRLITKTMSKHRTSRRTSQGGTIPRTAAPQAPGVAQFSMSEVPPRVSNVLQWIG
jgi:hypothetical protein